MMAVVEKINRAWYVDISRYKDKRKKIPTLAVWGSEMSIFLITVYFQQELAEEWLLLRQ